MRNKLLALVLTGVMVLSVTACGKEETEKSSKQETKEETTVPEYDVNDYVTLGDYKGVEVTLEGEYEYSDEGFDAYVNQAIANRGVFVADDSQTEVKEDSIVNVDYVGSQDGVAFDGGSAEDQTLDVANNSMANGSTGFIDGFTAGLVGHSVGEEVAYEVTFPEQYQSADLAGQTVVFTFQINYIAKAIDSKDKLTDDIVADNFSYDTVDEYLASLKESYEKQLESNLENDKETSVMNAVINGSTVSDIPEGLLQARVDMTLYLMDLQYQSYGTTLKDYAESSGYDYDTMVESMTENVKTDVETELILQAIAEAEGFEIDEDEYNDFITPLYQKMGYKDAESFYDAFTFDGYTGERYFRLAFLTEKAEDFCIENAVVNATSTIAD